MLTVIVLIQTNSTAVKKIAKAVFELIFLYVLSPTATRIEQAIKVNFNNIIKISPPKK